MPQYIVIRIKGSKSFVVGLTPNLANVRRAWGFMKKNHKRKIHKGWAYHIFPINHARDWTYKKGKWVIGSWYGNHNSTEYAELRRQRAITNHYNRIEENKKERQE